MQSRLNTKSADVLRRSRLLRAGVMGVALLAASSAAQAQTPAASSTEAQTAQASGDAPVVETNSGPVRGATANGVHVFKGIRYGADTSGENRFMAPKAPEAWTEAQDVTEFGARCHGPDYPPFLMQEEGVDLDMGPMSEDCLFLNVWTAGLDDGEKRPVMVWFHGGGFTAGSGGSVRYDGTNLASKRGVVLVTVNHRLGPLGFMDLSANGDEFKDSGNAGMLDIVAALQWVQDNAAKFGGDPDNVTVFGESGGGSKVTTLMSMPAAEGLFDKVAAQSGQNIKAIASEQATETAKTAMEAIGAADVAALRAASPEDIVAKAKGNWGPVIGASLPRSPFDPDADPMSKDIPLLIGSNRTEATFFNATPRETISDEDMTKALVEGNFTKIPEANVADLVAAYREKNADVENHELVQLIASDAWMTGQVAKVADLRAAAGAPTWVYHFAMRQGAQDGKLNVPHTAEIAYVFDNLELSKAIVGEADAEDIALAEQMSTAWTNFAKTGDPKAEGLPEWPQYTTDNKAVMVFDESPEVVVDPFSAPLAALAKAKAM